jgi:NTE family protein
MAGSEPYIRLLASVPAFAALDTEHLQTLYRYCALKVAAKGEPVPATGESVDELGIVVSGRIVFEGPDKREAGPGTLLGAWAFFNRAPVEESAIALRETVLLTLAWDDFIEALQASPALALAFVPRHGAAPEEAASSGLKLARIVICPAGAQARLDAGMRDALLAAFESVAEIRILRRQSFGAGMPGALALDDPGIANWLQEQELEFDLTITIPGEEDIEFAKEVIAEADGVLFVAGGSDPALSELERYALDVRGPQNCRLLLAKTGGGPRQDPAAWREPRGYVSMRTLDFASPSAIRLMGQHLLGKGHAIAAASSGVYAAAIWGALRAFEEYDEPAVCLAGAGSAVLPAGLLACGLDATAIDSVFRELANPSLWKRASRPEAGLYDPAGLDTFLVNALKGLEIPAAARPFAAVSRSHSEGAPQVHLEGRLHGAVRAGIAPHGILPPLILDGGEILLSGESETQALLAAAKGLTASPVSFVYAKPAPAGCTPMTYRSLTGFSLFRLTQTPFDKRVRLETVLGAGLGPCDMGQAARVFALPVPEGIAPMDWPEWMRLRDKAYEWTMRELEGAQAAPDEDGPA